MNEKLIRDLTKGINNTPLKQELPAGATPRRYEPECGIKKHNERIHRESKYADAHKNLPFTFRKAYKPKGQNAYVHCDNCGHITSATTVTVGMICKECGKFSTVTEV
jgi:ribosomal protein S27E